MYLVVYQVMQLQVVHVAYGYPVLEGLAGAAVIKHRLAVPVLACLYQHGLYVLLGSAVEYRGGDVPAQGLCGHAQMQLKHLTNVHSGRHAQGVQHYLQGGAVGQEGHILLGKYPGYNTLVAVAARHLIAYGYLALLRYVYANQLVYSRRQLVLVRPREYLYVYYDSAFAMRHA